MKRGLKIQEYSSEIRKPENRVWPRESWHSGFYGMLRTLVGWEENPQAPKDKLCLSFIWAGLSFLPFVPFEHPRDLSLTPLAIWDHILPLGKCSYKSCSSLNKVRLFSPSFWSSEEWEAVYIEQVRYIYSSWQRKANYLPESSLVSCTWHLPAGCLIKARDQK